MKLTLDQWLDKWLLIKPYLRVKTRMELQDKLAGGMHGKVKDINKVLSAESIRLIDYIECYNHIPSTTRRKRIKTVDDTRWEWLP